MAGGSVYEPDCPATVGGQIVVGEEGWIFVSQSPKRLLDGRLI
jgi:hypothetical protein